MTNKIKHLQIKVLDEHLKNIQIPPRPHGGWIATIRKALGMNVRQLAERMGSTQQSTAGLENSEQEDTITLKYLRKAASALNCSLIYAFVPNEGSLQKTIDKQAELKAKETILAVNHTMLLEGQSVEDLDEQIFKTAKELGANPNSKLWD
jgi:predicted DNA-binding mobile mystery protein A